MITRRQTKRENRVQGLESSGVGHMAKNILACLTLDTGNAGCTCTDKRTGPWPCWWPSQWWRAQKWWAGGSQPVPHCYSHMESSVGQVADHMSQPGLFGWIWHVQQPSQLVVHVAWAYFQFSQTDSVETKVLLSPCLDRLYSNQLCMNSIATEKLGTKGKSSKVYRNSGKQTSISKTQLHTASSRLAGVRYQINNSTGRQSGEERAAEKGITGQSVRNGLTEIREAEAEILVKDRRLWWLQKEDQAGESGTEESGRGMMERLTWQRTIWKMVIV